LIRPWDASARRVSSSTAGVKPASPIITTGDRAWACARKALRCAELSRGGAVAAGSSEGARGAAVGRLDGDIEGL